VRPRDIIIIFEWRSGTGTKRYEYRSLSQFPKDAVLPSKNDDDDDWPISLYYPEKHLLTGERWKG